MEAPSPQTEPPPARKKIRLTKSEVYAMGLSGPKKNRIAFSLIALLIAVALGNVLWHFQDLWLPYWFSSAVEQAAPAIAPAADESAPAPADAGSEAQAVAPGPIHLDFLSAALWDHPAFLQGVRTFNQALDRHRQFLRDGHPAALLPEIEEGAAQAARLFESIRAEAPAAVPIGAYAAAGERLAAEARRLARPAPGAPARADDRPGGPWRHPDYLAGAKLFNGALEQYTLFLDDKSRTDLLKPIEDAAFQAAKKFEALRGQAPEGVPLNDHITQCYKLVSDCRRQHLEGANAEPAAPFERGTAGPSRRPALPAYQPPP